MLFPEKLWWVGPAVRLLSVPSSQLGCIWTALCGYLPLLAGHKSLASSANICRDCLHCGTALNGLAKDLLEGSGLQENKGWGKGGCVVPVTPTLVQSNRGPAAALEN